MKEYVLDFAGLDSRQALHAYLKEVFPLPDYYGRNLDALWDCLYQSFDGPTRIVLRNTQALPASLRTALLELFSDLEREDSCVTLRLERPD